MWQILFVLICYYFSIIKRNEYFIKKIFDFDGQDNQTPESKHNNSSQFQNFFNYKKCDNKSNSAERNPLDDVPKIMIFITKKCEKIPLNVYHLLTFLNIFFLKMLDPKLRNKFNFYENASYVTENYLNVIYYAHKFEEIDRLKVILMNEEQINIFNLYLKKNLRMKNLFNKIFSIFLIILKKILN